MIHRDYCSFWEEITNHLHHAVDGERSVHLSLECTLLRFLLMLTTKDASSSNKKKSSEFAKFRTRTFWTFTSLDQITSKNLQKVACHQAFNRNTSWQRHGGNGIRSRTCMTFLENLRRWLCATSCWCRHQNLQELEPDILGNGW